MKFLIFSIFAVNFALLDPDPVDQNQWRSGSATLGMPLENLKETDVSLVIMMYSYVEKIAAKNLR
jgi:hypothetical protein